MSSNSKVLPSPIDVATARDVLVALRRMTGHQFVTDDVSITDGDVSTILGHRQVTDAHLLTIARRNRVRLVTFDAGIAALAAGADVEILSGL